MVLLVGTVVGGRVALLSGFVGKSPPEAAVVLGAGGPELPEVAFKPKSTDEVDGVVTVVVPACEVAAGGKSEGVDTLGEIVWEDPPNNELPEGAWLPIGGKKSEDLAVVVGGSWIPLVPVAVEVELLGSISLGLFNFSNGFNLDASESAGFLGPKRPPEDAVMPPNTLAGAAKDFVS